MYYVMTCRGKHPRTTIGESPDVPMSPWNGGHIIEEPIVEPLVYTLDPDYPGNTLAMYSVSELLVRDDLMAALRRAGVDNLQTFRAVIVDPATGQRHEDYSAVNIVGLVAAADMAASTTMAQAEEGVPEGIGFDSLVIDVTKPGGVLMFRLAESVNAIVVHERVRKQIEADGIPGMTFWEPGEWAG